MNFPLGLNDTDKKNILSLHELVSNEKEVEFKILQLLARVWMDQIHQRLGYYSIGQFMEEELNLSKDIARSRALALRTLRIENRFWKTLKARKTHVTHLALIARKITEANSGQMLEFLPGKSKRELIGFLSTIDAEGNIIQPKPTFEVKLRVDAETLDNLQRAVQLLSNASQYSDKEATVGKALNVLLDKIDPVRKARRAARLAEKKLEAVATGSNKLSSENRTGTTTKTPSRYIPQSIRHQVTLRDGGQCCYTSDSGKRCKSMITQIDHKQMWCRGGRHDLSNLQLLCPSHNSMMASVELGRNLRSFASLRMTDAGRNPLEVSKIRSLES